MPLEPASPEHPQLPRLENPIFRVILYFIGLVGVIIFTDVFAYQLLIWGGVLSETTLTGNPHLEFSPVAMLVLVSCRTVGVVLFTRWFCHRVEGRAWRTLGVDLRLGHLVQGLVWGAGLILVCAGLLQTLGNVTFRSGTSSAGVLMLYLLIFVFAGVMEELVFRGYILGTLMERMDKYIALGVSAFLFMMLHIFNPNISQLGTINLTLAGFLLGIYYLHQRNIWFSVGMHVTWNFVQGPLLGFEVSGLELHALYNPTLHGSDLLTGGKFGLEGSILLTVLMILAAVYIHFQFKE
ncbi:MAG: CPBP family intramembrane metalloprotease [Gemmatimonadetes bacterium]|nr:MAG: CPBP family intramembrane metalloprotease [Gemmatimonadota bacterium]